MTLAQDFAALRWLLLSPPLLADAAMPEGVAVQRFSADEAACIAAWLNALEAHPQPLVEHLAQARANAGGIHAPGSEPLRLGRLAERLLEFFLARGPLHRLIGHNLPVRATSTEGDRTTDRTTKGEIDFLLHSTSGTALHWELAVKYFLCRAEADTATASDYIGPDAAETFDHKLHKITRRQLQLKAPPPFDVQAWQPEAYVRGWMFYRLGRPIPHCNELAADHLRGWWLPLDECGALPAGARYTELPRGAWMPPHQQNSGEGLWAASEVAQALAERWRGQSLNTPSLHPFARIQRAQRASQKPSARLIVAMREAQGQWLEAARYFVAPP